MAATDKITPVPTPTTPRADGPASETWGRSIPASAIPGSGNHRPDTIEPKPKPKPVETNFRTDGK